LKKKDKENTGNFKQFLNYGAKKLDSLPDELTDSFLTKDTIGLKEKHDAAENKRRSCQENDL